VVASGTTRKFAADIANQVNDIFTLSAADRDVTITNFDSLSKAGTASHDLIDLTAIFDSLGGKFSDGVNDTLDRAAALQFQTGNFDGDGKIDDLRVTIAGVQDFAVTLIDPADSSKSSYGIYAKSSGSASDIVVGGSSSPTPTPAPTTPTPAGAGSANNASTSGQTPLFNTALQAFAINANHQITINGVADAYTTHVLELVYNNGSIYQRAGDANSSSWWQYTPGTGWHNWSNAAGDPRIAVVTAGAVSPNGASISANDAALISGTHSSFAISADHHVVINGAADAYTANVQQLVYQDANIYQQAGDASSSGWWEYTPGSGWHNWTEVSGDPRGAASTPSTSGSQAASADGAKTTIGGNPLYNGTHDAFSINANHQVVIDGVADSYTSNVLDLLYKNSAIYQHAGDANSSGWWQYTPGSGWHDWTQVNGDPSSGAVTPIPVVTTPAPTVPSSSNGLFEGKFPAHWARLQNGVVIERGPVQHLTQADYNYLHGIGIENVRILKNPYQDGLMHAGDALNVNSSWMQAYKNEINMAVKAGLAVVVSWSADFPLSTDKASMDLYAHNNQIFASWIKANWSPSDIFIEMRNEPFMQHAQDYWNIEDQAIKAIHSVAPQFTVIAESNGYDASLAQPWDQTKTLTMLPAHNDPNVVYNVHDYAPMQFTHQGASWVTWAASLHNIPYPYGGVDVNTFRQDFATLKAWADKYNTFITVNEFGAIGNANHTDAVKYLTDMHTALSEAGFGWDVFGLNSGFTFSSVVNGATVVADDIQKALSLGHYDTTPDWTHYHDFNLLG
jgi:endoglucanase